MTFVAAERNAPNPLRAPPRPQCAPVWPGGLPEPGAPHTTVTGTDPGAGPASAAAAAPWASAHERDAARDVLAARQVKRNEAGAHKGGKRRGSLRNGRLAIRHSAVST